MDYIMLSNIVVHEIYGQVLHGEERGEKSGLLLSPLRPSFKNPGTDVTQTGSQLTLFLAAPLQAFCQLVGFVSSDEDMDCSDEADGIISTAFAEWEVILCTSNLAFFFII
ncbi:hypothetical protein KY284_016584 [Solanum tuberosum]|nr:hypothetical protein KY284_016584 [Solanum tuberosum]